MHGLGAALWSDLWRMPGCMRRLFPAAVGKSADKRTLLFSILRCPAAAAPSVRAVARRHPRAAICRRASHARRIARADRYAIPDAPEAAGSAMPKPRSGIFQSGCPAAHGFHGGFGFRRCTFRHPLPRAHYLRRERPRKPRGRASMPDPACKPSPCCGRLQLAMTLARFWNCDQSRADRIRRSDIFIRRPAMHRLPHRCAP